ncbi:MAG: glycerol-3-phosphate acyltransferase [Prochlorotrichaceae cyanobacterium]
MQDSLILLGSSFALGALPIVAWITHLLARKHLQELGTGNIGVSAAFYHGGTIAGLLAVASEAGKGIGVVLLARWLFPHTALWEQAALISLVLGRFSLGKGAGTTNLAWGYLVHDGNVALFVILIGSGCVLLVQEKRLGKWLVLGLLPLITAFVHPSDGMRTGMAMLISLMMGAIYSQMPDDLDLKAEEAQPESRRVFQFFQGSRSLLTLDQPLDPEKVGNKAATLAELKRAGYPDPKGWVMAAGDDPTPLLQVAQPAPLNPVVVRSSAVGEDGLNRSAAGQYLSLLNIKSADQLLSAVNRCLQSYDRAAARQYRADNRADTPGATATAMMAVLVQPQIIGQYSGVAFSRDPLAQQGEAVIIEALAGETSQVVSGRYTPEQYRVYLPPSVLTPEQSVPWQLPQDLALTVEGHGRVPERIIEQVAYLVRHLENYYHGIPQDIEWSYDGRNLWLLQCRPITNLTPIWTRKIAAEVIPGCIRPLTWSINRPLTCGVWGDIFTIVLGDRAQDLDFSETATLHFGHAYFNATLLGEIFQRMGLPPNSLEFLTRGASFSKPPLASTLRNVPGLLRLLGRELRLSKDFAQDDRLHFQPMLTTLRSQDIQTWSAPQLLDRCEQILATLQRATYYSILAPLSFALRQKLSGVKDDRLDNNANPEVAALAELQGLAIATRVAYESEPESPSQLEGETPETNPSAIQQHLLQEFLDRYGYLSEVGTDISVPTWKEQPQLIESLLHQYVNDAEFSADRVRNSEGQKQQTRKEANLQKRLNIKGKVTAIYSELLAELRYSFLALEQQWLASGLLQQAEDIFYWQFEEIKAIVAANGEQENGVLPDGIRPEGVPPDVAERRRRFDSYQHLPISFLVYGVNPPDPDRFQQHNLVQSAGEIQGIGASQGVREGVIQRIPSFQVLPNLLPYIDRSTILVVPYTDSGWAPLLAKAGGLIAEAGGQLSHGAIVAREYGIPAVMNVTGALQIFADGDRVRLDGGKGTIVRL